MTTFGRWWSAAEQGLLVVLVRHGRTAYNAQGRFLGRTDIPLDEVGRAEAEALAEALPGPVDAVYSSSLSRALDTARFVHPHPQARDDLQELFQGELEGLRVREGFSRFPDFFSAWAEDPTDVTVPGGESLGACRDRALGALEEIAALHGVGERVVVVSHQLVIASLLCSVHGKPLSRWREHGVRNASASLLQRTGFSWRVVAEDLRSEDSRSPGGRQSPDV